MLGQGFEYLFQDFSHSHFQLQGERAHFHWGLTNIWYGSHYFRNLIAKWFWIVVLVLISGIVNKHAQFFNVFIGHLIFFLLWVVYWSFMSIFLLRCCFLKKMTCKNCSRKNSTLCLLMLQKLSKFAVYLFISFILSWTYCIFKKYLIKFYILSF